MQPSSSRLAAVTVFCGLAAILAGCGGDSTTSGTTGTPDAGPTFHYAHDDTLRLNQFQAKGTHNSYHIAQPEAIKALAYTHAPLDVQFREEGVRQIELDTHYNYQKEVYEVYHLGTIDEGTTCRLFVDCLKTIKTWSDANPAHLPIFIQIEPKDSPTKDESEDLFKRLEDEVLSVFPKERVVTPDSVRGSAKSVREGLAANGWPTLGEVRGKIIFFVDNSTGFREYYTHENKDLEGRLMFIDGEVDSPWAGVILANTPDTDAAKIAAALKANLIVRTRADGDNEEPYAGDTTHRDEAIASGAQMISTDYPVAVKGVPAMGAAYVVEIPEGTPARCNPVTAPKECASKDIEDPQFMH
jgi:calcium-dependent phosphoinositide phospholipase C